MSAPIPKVFISAATSDLGSIRQLVKEALLSKGCHPVEQTNFPPDAGTVPDMLRGRIGECQALIHVVGMRYGAEPDPATVPGSAARRSYTQMEYHTGLELQQKRGPNRFRVFSFVCPEDFPYDAPAASAPPESDEKRTLQKMHRKQVLTDTHLREKPSTPDQLRDRILTILEEVHTLRAAQSRAARAILMIAVLIAASVLSIGWEVHHTRRQTASILKHTIDPEAIRASLIRQIEAKAESELNAARKAEADWRKRDAIANAKHAALRKADDIIATIKAGLAGDPSPIFLEATQILRDQGIDEALAYLSAQTDLVWGSSKGQKTLKLNSARRHHDALRPFLLQADLLESRIRYEEAANVMTGVAKAAPEWGDAQNRLGYLLLQLAQHSDAEKHLRLAETLASSDAEVATALANLAQLLQDTNRLAEAEPLMRRALALDEASFGSDHPNVATHLNNLAQLLQATNRLAEAEPLMRRTLAIDEASFGSDHPNVATDLNNLALLLKDTNRLAEAEPLMRRTLAIDEASFGSDHPNVATHLNNLALLLQDTNRIADAEPLMRRALAIVEASFGSNHPNVATHLNNLAALLQDTNRIAEAEPLMRRALAIVEASFDSLHPRVATALANLAQVLQDTNRLADAEPLMRRALAIDEASFGSNHPNVAIGLNNLAALLKDTNRINDAEPIMRRALAIDEASFGDQHPNVAIRLNNLATLLQDTNRLAEAESLMRRALAIDEASFDSQHPKVAIRLNNLALLLQATNRINDAEPLMRRALAIDEASFGDQHPNVAKDLNNLAALLQATNRIADAEPLMRRALAIDEASFGDQHPNVARDLNNLAQVLQETNRIADAEPLMRRALAIDEASFGSQHPNVATNLNNLAQLLQATNQLADAEPLMRRPLAIYLTFYKSTRHEHPHTRTVLRNYAELCDEMNVPREEIGNRLRAMFAEAGVSEADARRILDEVFPSEPE